MKKLIFTLLTVAFAMVAQAQTARVMAIHNSADPAVDTVDVYIWANNAVFTKVENLGFRASTGFVSVPANTNIRVAFAGKNSTRISDTIVGFGFNLTTNATYVLMAQGHVSNGFTPQKPFELHVVAPAKENNRNSDDLTAFVVVHGATDAPAVEVIIRDDLDNDGEYIDSLVYGTNSGYLEVPELNYFVDVYPYTSNEEEDILSTYQAPLAALNFGDSAIVVFASGFINRTVNKNGAGFGLFVALSNGTVIPLPTQNTFRLQAIHNSADPAADTVDVWLINKTTGINTKVVSNFSFRSATPYIDAPALQSIAIGVAPRNSTIRDTIYVEHLPFKVPGGVTLNAIAFGVLNPSNFQDNPDGIPINFGIHAQMGYERSIIEGGVTFTAYHGVTDAPTVDIDIREGSLGVLLREGSFGRPDGIRTFATTAGDFTIDVTSTGTSTPIASYTAPFANFGDSAVLILASGFLTPNVPVGKDNGQAFALVAITSSGRAITLPVFTGVKTISAAVSGISIYPNPAKDNITFRSAESNLDSKIVITDVSGKTLVEKDWNGAELKMNTEGFESGIYFVQIRSEKGLAYQKLIIE